MGSGDVAKLIKQRAGAMCNAELFVTFILENLSVNGLRLNSLITMVRHANNVDNMINRVDDFEGNYLLINTAPAEKGQEHIQHKLGINIRPMYKKLFDHIASKHFRLVAYIYHMPGHWITVKKTPKGYTVYNDMDQNITEYADYDNSVKHEAIILFAKD